MKTQIIRLEPHDDFISARDKMGWSQTGRILLVWPDQKHVLDRRLDLALLQRHSMKLGAQLAIVSQDSEAKYQARKLGIPVFRSIPHAQKSRWRSERRARAITPSWRGPEEPRPDLQALKSMVPSPAPAVLNRPAVRLIFFTLGVLALLSIAALLAPSSQVNLDPAIEIQEATLSVRANPEIEKASLSGAVPARWSKVVVEARSSTASLGTTRVPQEYASGSIQITNLTDQPVPIPQGTVVRSLDEPPVRFATTRSAEVPAGVGKTLSLPIKAERPGTFGNLTAGTLIAIEGALGASLTATNPRPTTGGGDQILAIPTAYNRQQLYEKLEVDLRETALQEFQMQLAPGSVLFTPTITISQVIEQQYDPAEDLPSDQLGLNLRIEYQALTVSVDDILNMSELALDANLPSDFSVIPDTLQVDNRSQPVFENESTMRWQVVARRQIQARFTAQKVTQLVLGMPPEQAARRLNNDLPLTKEPTIVMNPEWWPRMPILPFRIQVSTD